eukprot:3685451-Prymnesium_polylepis.1
MDKEGGVVLDRERPDTHERLRRPQRLRRGGAGHQAQGRRVARARGKVVLPGRDGRGADRQQHRLPPKTWRQRHQAAAVCERAAVAGARRRLHAHSTRGRGARRGEAPGAVRAVG